MSRRSVSPPPHPRLRPGVRSAPVVGGLLGEVAGRHAEARPEATAVVCGGERLTYGGLEERANRLARLLVEAGCRPGDRVALLAPKSVAAVAALVGIYKSGAIYVPLDPASPAARLARILRSCGPSWLVAGDGTAVRLAELAAAGAMPAGTRLGWLGAAREAAAGLPPGLAPAFDIGDLEAASAAPLPPRTVADAPAHILYTSGSTGEPKGVMVTHANVLGFVGWALDHFAVGDGERWTGHSPLHFDVASFDLFGAFAAGAELHLVPPELNLLPHRVAALLRDAGITSTLLVPSVMAYLARFDAVGQDDFPRLERLIWCGEVLPAPVLDHWMRRLPHVAFHNVYGPTETTIGSSCHDVSGPPEDLSRPVPIGVACGGEGLSVLDRELAPAADGELGEIVIRGAGLSPGYWRDPRRTAAAFVPDPEGFAPDPERSPGAAPGGRVYRTGDLGRRDADGVFHFAGRADSQIKSRGFRIELGEVESAVAATGLAAEAVVTAVTTGGFEGSLICCAYAPAPGAGEAAGDGGAAALRRALGALVPAYMLPAHWLTLERLPKNPNGKLDRPRVRAMFAERLAAAGSAAAAAPAAGDGARREAAR